MENNNLDTLSKFTAYCVTHPEQRFWQALCNFAHTQNEDVTHVLIATGVNAETLDYVGVEDTFYWKD
jgi:hypothetical protein